ncbi:MAG: DUF1841 family protein [Proteobacteria bacterium]|jgi:hypothetical protein|nr:DUF1841 family protein [Pseudomonadota bacterium]
MFTPTRDESRRFLIETWRKYRAGEPLAGLEQAALPVIAMHPEYHPLLEAGEDAVARDFPPEAGATNPFLHLSLHLAVTEQLAIDQPPGVRAHYLRLAASRAEAHDAAHALIECLGETLWQAQRNGTAVDAADYLGCLERQR